MHFEDWGIIDYREALNRQLRIVDDINASKDQFKPKERFIFCSHYPIVTIGRSTQAEEISNWKGPKIEISRGGRATFHGPSQIMLYSILSLKQNRKSLRARDIFSYLRLLESVLVRVLKEFKVKARAHSSVDLKFLDFVLEKNKNQEKGEKMKEGKKKRISLTGVWVGNKKLISIGVAFKNWVSYHGASIHFDKDEGAFKGIRPCGFSPQTMTSVEEVLGEKLDRSLFKKVLKRFFIEAFS